MNNDDKTEALSASNTQLESPDYLETPKKAKGVRRLNHVPLFIVVGLISLAFLGITYTFFQRKNPNGRIATGPQPPISTIAEPPVHPKDFPQPETQQQITPTPVKIDIPTENRTTSPTEVIVPIVASEATQNRLRIIQRIEERKIAQWEAALSTDGIVQSFSTIKETGRQTQENIDPYGFLRDTAAMGAMTNNMDNLSNIDNGQSAMLAENRQREKQAFLLESTESNIYLGSRRTVAISPSQEIKAGTVIPSIMISGLNSDLPGQILAQVRENVYDSATGQSLLIPAGARLVGTYDSQITLGQKRALVGWQRIIYPDGSSLSLDRMPGADVSGYAGFSDRVNNHYGRIFGNGLLLSVFSAGIQLSQPQASNGQNYNNSQVVAGAIGQQMGQLGMQMAQRNMNIQPTLEVRPGYPFNVMVTKDIILPPWTGHPSVR